MFFGMLNTNIYGYINKSEFLKQFILPFGLCDILHLDMFWNNTETYF